MTATSNADTAPASAPYISARAKAQSWWIKIHRWMGLALLIPMAILGVTGSAQVWPEETEALLNPQREVAASADPAALQERHFAAANDAMAEFGVMRSVSIGEVGTPLTATSTPHSPPLHGIAGPVSQMIYLDPDSAAVIDSAPTSGSFMWYMHFIHGLFLIPDGGRKIVGYMGWLLLISSITGIVVFWPGRKKVVAALKWRKHEGKAMNLHRQSGFILSVVLIVEAVSGAWISFPEAMASLVEPGVEQPQRRRPGGFGPEGEPVAMPAAAWVDAVSRAQQAYPGRPTSINAPVGENGAWMVSLSGETMDANVTLPVAADGEIAVEESEKRVGPPPATTRAGAIATVMRQLHYALIGGIIWEVLVFLSGIALTFLSISGVYVWARRKLKRKAA